MKLFPFRRPRQNNLDQDRLYRALPDALMHLRALQEPARLQNEIVLQAASLFQFPTSVLLVNRPLLHELEVIAVHNLTQLTPGRVIAHGDGLAGHCAISLNIETLSAATEIDPLLGGPVRGLAVAVPLLSASQLDAVLLLVNPLRRALTSLERQVMLSFAEQAGIAMLTSSLIHSEPRKAMQVTILHKISDFIQAAEDIDQILHVVLTGITAGYGLGFNRAALFLLDERGETLVGRMGIGHMDGQKARRDWSRDEVHGLESFDKYVQLLKNWPLPLTPVGERVRGLSLPARGGGFIEFLNQLGLERCIVMTDAGFYGVPLEFLAAFEPAPPLVVAPLVARGKVIGVLVADNKFTRSPITLDAQEDLLTFANTAAVAIVNNRLFQEARLGQEQLRSYYEASNALTSSDDPERVLEQIVQRACQASHATGVSMVLLDKSGQASRVITGGEDKPVSINEIMRKDGYSMQVLTTGDPVVIEDTRARASQVNPTMFVRNLRAALCLPISAQGERLGVMWFHYRQPRQFHPAEIEAARLYVNQAALAYDNARRFKELDFMRRAAGALAGAVSTAEVLGQIVRSACEVLQADSAAIWAYDGDRKRFVTGDSVAYGISDEIWHSLQQEELQPGHTHYEIMERGWIGVGNIDDAAAYPFLGEPTRRMLNQIGVKSFQGIALTESGECVGVLFVNYSYIRSFPAHEQDSARTLANHAAVALKNTRLQARVRHGRDVAQKAASISVLGDYRTTLEALAVGTQETLACDTVTLYAYDQDTKMFEFPPAMAGVEHRSGVERLGRVDEESVVYKILMMDRPYATEDSHNDAIMNGPFVEREGIISSIGLPLQVSMRKVGVMFVNFRTRHHFSEDEMDNIELFSNQAAIAIRNGQLYKGERDFRQAFLAVQETSAAVSRELNLDKLLPLICRRAAEIFAAPAVSLMLWDEQHHNLVIREAFGLNAEYKQHQRIPAAVVHLRYGTTQGKVQVFDLATQPLGNPELVRKAGLCSVLAAPLSPAQNLIGVLNVYTCDAGRIFTDREKELASVLANHAAIAIQNARAYEELLQTRLQVHSRTTLAWLGMNSADYRHSIGNKAVHIKDLVKLMRRDIVSGETTDKLLNRLAQIEETTAEIREAPVTTPLLSEESVVPFDLHDLVYERKQQLWRKEPYSSASLEIVPVKEAVIVLANPDWVRRVLDILINNAMRAMREGPQQHITISFYRRNHQWVMEFADTGPGIDKEILPKLFKTNVPKEEGQYGMGVGLLMARTIMQAFGGTIDIKETSPKGTVMFISLPEVNSHDAR